MTVEKTTGKETGMGWFRRGTATAAASGRRTPSGPDPVAAAVAEAHSGGPLRRRVADLDAPVHELPLWIEVDECDDLPDFDTVAHLADEINAYTDAYEDGLEQALADQPGIEEVFAEDREVLHLRTRLALADVHAAVIRAVVEVNRSPRAPAPTGELSQEVVLALTDQVTPMLTEAGFVRREDAGRAWTYFHRVCGDGIVQLLTVSANNGVLGDGTPLEGRLLLMSGVVVPEVPHRGPRPEAPEALFPAHSWLRRYDHPAGDLAALVGTLRETTLPWLEGTGGRRAMAGWAAADPERVFPPAERPQMARLLALWGYDDAARAVLDSLRRRWKRLADDPSALEARRILADRR